jgi:hypothetical protein
VNYLEHLKIEPKEEFFEPCSHLDIILRSLRNLGNAFEKLGEVNKVEEVREMLAILENQ